METSRFASVCDVPEQFELRIVGLFDPRHISGSDGGMLYMAVLSDPPEQPLPEQHARRICR